MTDCPRRVETRSIAYPCILSAGHEVTGEPCMALESDKSVREHQAWQKAQQAVSSPPVDAQAPMRPSYLSTVSPQDLEDRSDASRAVSAKDPTAALSALVYARLRSAGVSPAALAAEVADGVADDIMGRLVGGR